MALRLGMRLWLSAGIFLALFVAPSTALAQDNPGAVRSDDQFYSLLTSPATAAPVASKTLNSGRSESAARGTQGTELKELPSPIVASAADIPTSASLPLPMGREQTIMGMLLSFSPITWAAIVAGIVALGAILWAATPLPCLLLGHRRCSRSVRFVDHEQRWVGNCKSCGIALVRDAKGTWKRAKVTWRKPEVLPEPVQYSSRVEEVSAEAGVQPVHLDTELEAVPRKSCQSPFSTGRRHSSSGRSAPETTNRLRLRPWSNGRKQSRLSCSKTWTAAARRLRAPAAHSSRWSTSCVPVAQETNTPFAPRRSRSACSSWKLRFNAVTRRKRSLPGTSSRRLPANGWTLPPPDPGKTPRCTRAVRRTLFAPGQDEERRSEHTCLASERAFVAQTTWQSRELARGAGGPR